jgi:hypothetical protein
MSEFCKVTAIVRGEKVEAIENSLSNRAPMA